MLGPRGEELPGFFACGDFEGGVRSSRGRALKPKRRLEEPDDVPAVSRRASRMGAREAAEQYGDDGSFSGVHAYRNLKASRNRHTDPSTPPYDANLGQEGPAAWPSRRNVHAKPPRKEYGTARGGGIFKSAAVRVLRLTKRLMCTGDITAAAVKHGFLAVQGRTPEATMASALYTDVKRKEARSVFFRPQEGLFGLREWLHPNDSFDSQLTSQDTSASDDFKESPWQPTWDAQIPSGQGQGPAVNSRKASSCSPTHGMAKPQFSNNMEVLMAAVDEVLQSEEAASSPEMQDEDSRWEAAVSAQAVKEESPVQETFQLQMPACSVDASHTEDGSSSQLLDTAPLPPLTAMPPPDAISVTLSGMLQAAQAEITVQALEADLSSDPSVVMQGYMHLCKVYGEAGLLEKACSSLARAMEIGEALARP